MNSSLLGCVGANSIEHLESCIERRTGGRVYRLRVETSEGRVVVRGHAGSYYVRQLALAAVLDALEQTQLEPVEVEVDIQVGAGSATSARETADKVGDHPVKTGLFLTITQDREVQLGNGPAG
jgi:hypothetical protein